MRKFVLSLAGIAAIGLGALAAQPAQAQGFSVTFGTGYPGVYHPTYPPMYRPYPVVRTYPVRPYPYYGRPVVYGGGYGYGPRCFVRSTRYWDGFEWVVERRRVCR